MKTVTHSEEWHLPTQHIGRRVLYFDRIDSTNTQALSLADDPANDGVVLLAAAQNAGRGQHGRTWLAPPGSSVLMTALLFPEGKLLQPAILTAWAAVSVCRLIEKMTGLQARIKWPNDVFLAGRKTCGILIEQQSRRGLLAAAAGIGLNVTQAQQDFEAATLPDATSLFAAFGQIFDSRTIAMELIGVLDDEYRAIAAGDLDLLESNWKRRLGLLGEMVVVECARDDIHGRLLDLTFQSLEVELSDGEIRRIPPETVRHLTCRDARLAPGTPSESGRG